MFTHAWHWVTRSTSWAAPIWFCAKSQTPCAVEK